jgi:glycerophosphoryl diester phosphodiesterase
MMRKIIFFAHRGGGEGVFENRLETIKSTLEKDYIDAIEIDVRVTKDEILVIHHDRGVYVNGRKIWIDELDYQKIKSAALNLNKAQQLELMGALQNSLTKDNAKLLNAIVEQQNIVAVTS